MVRHIDKCASFAHNSAVIHNYFSVIEVKRRKGESFESLLRRFSKRVQQSGNILQVRKIRFHKKMDNKNKTKQKKLRSLEIGDKREWLLKTGRVTEEELRTKRRPSR